MKHTNINFVRKKDPVCVHGEGRIFFYVKEFHLSIVDGIWYHILSVRSLIIGSAIVAAVLAEKVFSCLIFFMRLGSQCLASAFVFIKIIFAIAIRLPFLFFLFCVRICGEYISEFTCDLFMKTRERVATTVQEFLATLRSYALPKQWHIHIAVFCFIALFAVSPFMVFGSLDAFREVKRETTLYIETGFKQFFLAANALTSYNTVSALQEFQKSSESFQNAAKLLHSLGSRTLFIARLIPISGKKIQDAESLIGAGEEFSGAFTEIATTFSILSSPDAFGREKLPSSLAILQEAIDRVSIRLEKGYRRLVSIDSSSIPNEFADQFDDVKKSILILTDTLLSARPIVSALPSFLGVQRDQRYLVVLQNNSEIRPTGGFMGSFALIDVKMGAVKKIEIPAGGTYDVQGQLREWVVSPWPLHLINARWEFQDANWFPDFPASARKIKWFYENAGGPTVDGVIALNASLAREILALTGPVYLSQFKKSVSADNFFETTQRAVELEYNRKENAPKKFLGELIETIVETIKTDSGAKGNKIAALLIESILTKEIQLYSADPYLQEILVSAGLSGRLIETGGDYLMIVDTNIGGRKTDIAMSREAEYNVHVNSDGALDATLTITSTHNGKKGDYFTGGKNINYARVYAPSGSVLLSAEGFAPPPRSEFENPPPGAVQDEDLSRIQGPFTVDEETGMILNHEFGKTVFSNWIQTDVGETSKVRISYRLPFRLSDKLPYSLAIQRQSGSMYKKIDVSFDNRFNRSFEPLMRDEFIQLPFTK